MVFFSFAWRCIFKAALCYAFGKEKQKLAFGLLEDALTSARKEIDEVILCLISFLKLSMLQEQNEQLEREQETDKFLASFTALEMNASSSEQKQNSKIHLLKFLQVQRQSIIQMQQSVNVTIPKHHESGNSFAFLLALFLYFGPAGIEGTTKAKNLVNLVQVIASGVEKIPFAQKQALDELVEHFCQLLRQEGALQEAENLQMLLCSHE